MKTAKHLSLFYGLLLCLAIVGGGLSLKVTFMRMHDPDMMHSVLIWQGVQEYGLKWLKEWRFTQDNWIFSLVPFQGLMVQTTGNVLSTIVLSGWLIFVTAAVFSALIAKELAGYLAAMIVLAFLLYVNAYGHIEGFASYPVSHNITNLFGLISLWFLLRWLKNPTWFYGVTICFLGLIAGLSDPWLLPTFMLPMVLSLGIAGLLFKNEQTVKIQAWLPLSLMLLMVFLAVKTGLFGILEFMPPMHFSLGSLSTQLNNLSTLIGNLGGLFALLPSLTTGETLWPETQMPYAGISAFTVLLISSYSIFQLASERSMKEQRFFAFFAMFSVLGICAAYVISSVEASVTSSRFVINVLYIATISIVVLITQRWSLMPMAMRSVVCLVAVLYLIASALGLYSFSDRKRYAQFDLTLPELIATLDEHGLTYGYGPYHGSKSNVVTVMTNGRITLRPVTFDQNTGQIGFNHPQTSVRWFALEDVPKDQKKFFVYLTRATTECFDFEQCRQSLFHDFGTPSVAITLENGVIYVWNHPLINWQSIKVAMGESIQFNNSMILPHWSGWSITESWGTWSDGDNAFMAFEFKQPVTGDTKVRLSSKAYAPIIGLNQRINVYANQMHVAQLNFTPEENDKVREFIIPQHVLDNETRVSIMFGIENAFSPREKKISNDTRKLGLGLVEITFLPINE